MNSDLKAARDVRTQFAAQLQLKNLRSAWVAAVGRKPTRDEWTLLVEAMARLGQYDDAVAEVRAAERSGSYPGMMG